MGKWKSKQPNSKEKHSEGEKGKNAQKNGKNNVNNDSLSND